VGDSWKVNSGSSWATTDVPPRTSNESMQYARYEPRIIQYDTPYEDVEMRK